MAALRVSIFSIFEVHVAASARVAVAAYRGTGLSVCLSYEREVPLRASVKRVWVDSKLAYLKTLEQPGWAKKRSTAAATSFLAVRST